MATPRCPVCGAAVQSLVRGTCCPSCGAPLPKSVWQKIQPTGATHPVGIQPTMDLPSGSHPGVTSPGSAVVPPPSSSSPPLGQTVELPSDSSGTVGSSGALNLNVPAPQAGKPDTVGRMDRTIDFGYVVQEPESPGATAPTAMAPGSMSPGAATAGNDATMQLPPTGFSAADAQQPPTLARIDQTLDLGTQGSQSAAPTPDLSTPPKPGTVRLDQTIDLSALASQSPGAGEDTPPATPTKPPTVGRIDQTLDLGFVVQEPPVAKPGTVRVDQTIDLGSASGESAALASAGQVVKPATVRVDQTIDLGDMPPEVAARVTNMWAGSVEQTSPRTSLKGKSPTFVGKSTLVVQPRQLRAAEMQLLPDTDYELLNVIGEGGMGVVYAARQTSIDRTVAIKMVRAEIATDQDQRQKFLSEAVVTGELEHPNIVPIYELGANQSGALFYSMKRVQGIPWSDVIATKSVPENLEILMKVADAVAFAHSKGVVHRDLKPENVMLGEYGEVLVMDWGLALSVAGFRKSGSIVASTSMGGTPAYMAPEMASGPIERVGPPSDVYLLGAILYEIVTGFAPHTGQTTMKCLFSAVKNEIRATEKTGELVEIALKAMATDPAARQSSVLAFQAEIRQYQEHAESILLTHRAEYDLERGRAQGDYDSFSRAMFGFQEALNLWSGNQRAQESAARARLEYADQALRKGDFDLGLSLLDAQTREHQPLIDRLSSSRRERDARQQRLRTVRRALAALVVLVVGVVGVALVVVRSQRDRAVAAEHIATQERDRARTAEEDARNQRDDARQQRDKAEIARRDAEHSRQVAEVARNDAVVAKAAEEYEAYIARIGLAAAKIDENAFDQAYQLLQECPPELRHWEWGRLMYLCGQSQGTYACGAPVDAAVFNASGTHFATGSWDGKVRIWPLASATPEKTIVAGGLYVHAVAWSPDGRYLASGGDDPNGFLKLWDAQQGTLIRQFPGHAEAVLSVVFSRDGSRLLTTSYDKTARLWDVANGKLLRTWQGHNAWVWSAAFSPDERQVVTASQDGTVIVWSMEQTETKGLPVFTGHQGPVYAVDFAPDGRHVASGGYDKQVLLWEVSAARPIDFQKLVEGQDVEATRFVALTGHTGPVRAVKFSADGKQLVSGSQDNSLRVWNVAEGQFVKTLRGHAGAVRGCGFSPDGRLVVSAGHDQRAKSWDLARYEEVRVLRGPVLEGHSDAVLAAQFSPSGQQVVTASRDRTARTWEVQSGRPLVHLEEGHEFLASTAVFIPGTSLLATAAVDNTVRIWDLSTGTQRRQLDRTGRSAAMALSADGQLLLTGGEDRTAQLWNLQTGNRLQVYEGHAADVTAVAISPDGRQILTGDSNGRCRLMDRESGQVLWEMSGHSRKIVAVFFAAGGQRLVTASMDHTVGQWDVASRQELKSQILRHPDSVLAMDLSTDGRLAITSCEDGQVRLWNLEKPELLGTLHDSSGQVNAVDLSADGRRALTVSAWDRTVRLWDVPSRQEITGGLGRGQPGPFLDLKQAGGLVWSAVFSPDSKNVCTVGGNGARLWDIELAHERIGLSPHGVVATASYSADGSKIVTSGWDNSVKIWNAATGQGEKKLAGEHAGYINCAVFSRDGRLVLTASDDRTAKLWDLESATVLQTYAGHADRVRWAAFSPDERHVLTASNDTTVRIWDRQTAQLVRELRGHQWAVLSAVYSRDGRFILTGSEDNSARIWDAETGHELLRLSGHTAAVTSVSFSPDGLRALSASRDNTAKLWDTGRLDALLAVARVEQSTSKIDAPKNKTATADVAEKPTANSHAAERGLIDQAGAEPNPAAIAAAGSVPQAKEILSLKGHAQEVTSVGFSPDGRHAVTSSRDGTALIWMAAEWQLPSSMKSDEPVAAR